MESKSASKNNVTWFDGYVSQEDREKLHGHKGAAIWFTGLSASGKSTIAHLVEKELYRRGYSTYVLDGDNVRHGLCSDLTFGRLDREENIRRIGEMVKLFIDAGVIILTAFISPYSKDRQKVRSLCMNGRFFEIHVDCPPEICAKRDTKGVYAKAKAGIISEFTGISAPYEVPQSPDLTIQSAKEDAIPAAKRVIQLIEMKGILTSSAAEGQVETKHRRDIS